MKKLERFHGRVLAWVAAQPVAFDDARALADIYAHGLGIDDEVLKELVRLAHGSVRRVSVNLTNIFDFANVKGWAHVGMDELAEVSLFTGEAPTRRLSR